MKDRKIISTDKFSALAYKRLGNGPALVLLHGFPEDGDLWNNITGILSQQYTLIIPDLPGAGGSRYDGDQLTMELMAESVYSILEHEGIDKAVVAGHSMGGYTAMAFAELYSHKVNGLSMVHSVASADDDEKKNVRRKAIQLIRNGGKEAFLKQSTPGLFAEGFRTQHPETIKQQIERGMQVSDESIIAFYNAMIMRPDRTSTLSAATYPIQWIIGKEDNIAPVSKVLEQAQLSNITFVSLYNDAAHMSMIEQPNKLAKDISDFCAYAAGYKMN
jgi:pimeloyl-ACP methyl ester carboxylesterase